MITRYRIIWLVPDPYVGARLPLGALVERDGRVSFVRASQRDLSAVPHDAQALARLVSDELDEADEFDTLPASVGPQVLAGEPVAVPLSVPDDWLARQVLRAA